MYPETNIRHLFYVCGQPAIVDRDSAYVSHYSFRIICYPSAFFPEVTLALPQVSAERHREDSNRIAISKFESVRIRLLPTPSNRSLRWVKQWRALEECIREADLVCANIPDESGFLAALICRLLKKPLLVQVLGDWKKAVLFAGSTGFTRRVKSWLADWMTRIAVRSATLVFTQGHALFDQCHAINPNATRSDIVHSTVTEEDFFQRPARGFHKPLRILTVCRLEPGKGLDVLAGSIRMLLEAGLKVEWWCVGHGPAELDLKNLTQSLGLSDAVRFFGHVPHGPELFEFYRHSDIFALPSFNEGIPNAILEAMAHSMPIVATDVGSIGQAITNGVEGVLTVPGDAKSLAASIHRLADDYVAASLMVKAAMQKVRAYKADSFTGQHRLLIETAFGAIKPAPTFQANAATAALCRATLDYGR